MSQKLDDLELWLAVCDLAAARKKGELSDGEFQAALAELHAEPKGEE